MRLLPKSKSAKERIVVVARSTSARHLFQFFSIAAPNHDLVRFKGGDQPLDHIANMMTPTLLAQSLEPGATEVILVSGNTGQGSAAVHLPETNAEGRGNTALESTIGSAGEVVGSLGDKVAGEGAAPSMSQELRTQ